MLRAAGQGRKTYVVHLGRHGGRPQQPHQDPPRQLGEDAQVVSQRVRFGPAGQALGLRRAVHLHDQPGRLQHEEPDPLRL